MPLNEIEQHPYLKYFIKHHNGGMNVPWDSYTRMFIGSFPIYEITKTIYPENASVDRSALHKVGLWNFFYGSRSNGFWPYLLWCFRNINPRLFVFEDMSEADLIQFLEENNILLTDIIEYTNRFKRENGADNPYSSADNALMNREASEEVRERFSLNGRIVKWLTLCRNIDSIYFTAQGESGKSPAGWFYNMLNKENVVLREMHRYDSSVTFHFSEPINREITLFFLPTPSSSRSVNMGKKRSPHTMFYNYLGDIDPGFLRIIEDLNFEIDVDSKLKLSVFRENFIREWWFEFVRFKNNQYNGVKVDNSSLRP